MLGDVTLIPIKIFEPQLEAATESNIEAERGGTITSTSVEQGDGKWRIKVSGTVVAHGLHSRQRFRVLGPPIENGAVVMTLEPVVLTRDAADTYAFELSMTYAVRPQLPLRVLFVDPEVNSIVSLTDAGEARQ